MLELFKKLNEYLKQRHLDANIKDNVTVGPIPEHQEEVSIGEAYLKQECVRAGINEDIAPPEFMPTIPPYKNDINDVTRALTEAIQNGLKEDSDEAQHLLTHIDQLVGLAIVPLKSAHKKIGYVNQKDLSFSFSEPDVGAPQVKDFIKKFNKTQKKLAKKKSKIT